MMNKQCPFMFYVNGEMLLCDKALYHNGLHHAKGATTTNSKARYQFTVLWERIELNA